MKQIILTLFFTFICSFAYSQVFEWVKGMGGTDIDVGNSIATDALGNVYTTGYFQGTADFDPSGNTFNLSSTGWRDIFITKLDSSGSFVWAKRIGGLLYDHGNAIKLDAAGNIYVTGNFQHTVNFGPVTLISAGDDDIFIAKFDGGGNCIWAKRIGGTSTDKGNGIAVDSQGNIYTTGFFNGTVDFDPNANTFNLLSAGVNDIFISKLDSLGNFVWAKKMGGSLDDNGYSIILDGQDNIYTTGSFTNIVDFDPNIGTFNLTSNGTNDIFISKLDVAGNLLWAKNLGGNSSDYANAIMQDVQGNIYLTGGFLGANNWDIIVAKLDSVGNIIWEKIMGGPFDDIGTSIAVDTYGNVYTSGYFKNTVDFDPGIGTYDINSAGFNDIFISKLDTSGNFLWVKAIGGTGNDQSYALVIDANENIFTTGLFQYTVDFDPNNGIYTLSSAGNKDIFINKMNKCITISYGTLTITACDLYTANGQTFTTSGIYTQTLINAMGCDSVLTLNLTINHPTDSTLNQIACDTFTLNGQTYTSSGNYTQYFTNSNNCDSIIYLNLTIYTVGNDTLIDTACQSYTLYGQTYTASGIYNPIVPSCNTAITLILTINSPTSSSFTQTSCYSYTLNGQTYTSSGVYQQVFTNGMGCDSLLTLNLSIDNSTDSVINQAACYSFTLNNQTYTTSGTYTQTLTNAAGCDSLLTLNLSIHQATDTIINQIMCDSIPFTLNGQTYTTSGTYTQTLTNAAGCDSLITLNLNLHYSTYDTLTQNACGSIILNGQTFTTSGTYTQILTNVAGCDSILTLNLVINPAQSYSWTDFACDYYVTMNGNVYTSSGTYVEYELNNWGCYDTVNYILTIIPTTYISWTEDACGSYECNGVVYTQPFQSFECFYTIGCNEYWVDILIIPLNVNAGDVIACESWTNSIGDTYYSSGTYLDWGELYLNTDCYVNYLIDLTIVDSIVVSVTQNSGSLSASANVSNCYYQWIDCNSNTPIAGANSSSFTPTSNGYYAVIATENSCSDTSACYLVTNISTETSLLQSQIQSYPNPTKGTFTIDLGQEYDIAELKVSSLIGQQLSSQYYTHSQVLTVDMPAAPGIYFVSVKVESGEVVTIKVVKE